MLIEWLSDLHYRFRAIFRRSAMERELDDELRFHLDREAAKYVAAGMSPDDARRRARLAFGGVDRFKDESRESRGISLLDVTAQNLRYAFRTLRTNLGFTTAVVATLGLGLGANAAMFGVIDRLMFRPPEYLRDPAAVNRVYLFLTDRGRELPFHNFEYTRYLDLVKWTTSFSQTAAFHGTTLAVGSGDDVKEMTVGAVSTSFFDFFDAQPVLGRLFTTSEDSIPYGSPVVVLGYNLWQTRFGGRPDALGKQLQVGAVLCTVIGVAPRGFVGVSAAEPAGAFIPITTYAGSTSFLRNISDYYLTYRWGWMQMLVRRKDGVSVEAATTDLSRAFARSYDAEVAIAPRSAPPTVARPRALAAPVQLDRGPEAGPDARVIRWISGVALIVLLIACANVTNLLLARAIKRRREIAIRLALGVSRGRLLGQLMTESVVLAALGGMAGFLAADWGGRALRALFLPADTSGSIVRDGRTVLFAAGIALLCGLLTGLVPALHAGRDDLTTTLKSGAREGAYARSRVRSMLMVTQGVLCVILLVGAGLFVRSLLNVRSMRIGFDVDPVLLIQTTLRGTKLTDPDRANLMRRLEEEAATIPGVVSVSRAATQPFWNNWIEDLFVAGIDSVNALGRFTLQAGSVSYFRTMGTRLLRGRGFTESDAKNAPRVMVVSQAMAERVWPGLDPLGKCVRVMADTAPCTTVVGVAENIKQRSITDDSGLHYYMPIEQFYPEYAALFVRVRGDAEHHRETVRRRLQPLMPGTAFVTSTPLREIVDPNLRSWRLGATMFTMLGGLALLVAFVGLYSVIAYNVAQRAREIGIRIALGASPRDVLRLVVSQGVAFATTGIVLGGAIALWAGKWVGPLLFDVEPGDPVVFAIVAGVLLCASLIASAIPAMRAARVDPQLALRAE
jgi:putative ABC transport system permease protein